jgi:hypothetical protein
MLANRSARTLVCYAERSPRGRMSPTSEVSPIETPRDVERQVELEASGGKTSKRAIKNPPLFMPFNLLWPRFGPHDRIHRAYSRLVWNRDPTIRARLRVVWLTLRWLVVLWFLTGLATWKFGSKTKRCTGKRLSLQVCEQIYLALVHSIPPRSYYLFRLFESGNRRRAAEFIHRFETKDGLFHFVNLNLGDTSVTSPLGNKRDFSIRCRENGLATPLLYFEAEYVKIIHWN